MKLKHFFKKITPQFLFSAYHYCLAWIAAFYYRLPARKLIIIGVTGTKGKTTTANFLWAALNYNGYKTGLISTANIRIGDSEVLNKYHMTMPGRLVSQELLADMVRAGCKFCVAEVTSEGIKQWRHKGIFYDIAVFTGLAPEHLEAHGGSFEEYKKAKGKLFASLAKYKHKILDGKLVPKMIIANYDSEYKDYFLGFWADRKITYGFGEGADFVAKDIKNTPKGVGFSCGLQNYNLNILGDFNVFNSLPAIALGTEIKILPENIKEALAKLEVVPGRMEKIEEGQKFKVIVDYAHEKESMTALLETAEKLVQRGKKIIILLGAEGGGRDKAKRPIMGELSGRKADFVIVSNVDPYEDDPKPILEDIAEAAEKAGKKRGENLFVIEDRREGIKKALSLAQEKDLVLITGKGAEQSIVIGGIRYPWDDRQVVKEELRNEVHQQSVAQTC
ncbi:MAG: UDP-N-acetylmuramyl-tripeptide synthetase [bacterium]|nr:UDP-N-acetylmuramyl-tripeptide synthetase [bacterium]